MGDTSLYFYATTESQNIPEGIHKDHKVQHSTPHRSTQNPNSASESGDQMLYIYHACIFNTLLASSSLWNGTTQISTSHSLLKSTSLSEKIFRARKLFLVELLPGLIPFQLIIHMNG